jgi:membrane protein DedA with SNARE-associated domain
MINLASLVWSSSLWKWIHSLGGPGLILLGIVDTAPFISIPPGTVDVFLALLASHNRDCWAYYALMATIGEVAGGYATYRHAQKGGEKILEKKAGQSLAQRVDKWFQKVGGGPLVLVGAMLPPPFPFTAVLMAAGITHYPQDSFLLRLSAGRAVRFLVIAYLGRAYGQTVTRFFSRYYQPALYVLIALVVLSGVGVLVYVKWHKGKTKTQKH